MQMSIGAQMRGSSDDDNAIAITVTDGTDGGWLNSSGLTVIWLRDYPSVSAVLLIVIGEGDRRSRAGTIWTLI